MPSALSELRRLCPPRRLVPWEARQVAERQASRLLALQGVTEPPVPEQAIEYLPRVRVRYRLARELSGSVAWQDGAWQIVVNADDAWVRQRFSLAHELKHALDAPLADTLYGPRFDGDAARIAEQAADYFAACFLMPRAMLKRTFYDQGIRHERALARVFDVSVAAMRVRLDALKLHEPARVAA